MNSPVFAVIYMLLCVSVSQAQFFEDLVEGFGGENGLGYLTFRQLSNRISALETNIRTGAIGGCESGVLGPFTPLQRVAPLQFRGQFLAPPTISLALSDVVTINPQATINISIRPGQITRTGATVTITDLTNNIASAFVSYMVCPSNANFPITTNQNIGTGMTQGQNTGGMFPFNVNPFLLDL